MIEFLVCSLKMSNLQVARLSVNLTTCLLRKQNSLVRHCTACRLLYTSLETDDLRTEDKQNIHRKKNERERFKKLHRRVFTEDELRPKTKFDMSNLQDESDSFGQLSRRMIKSKTVDNKDDKDWFDVRGLQRLRQPRIKANKFRNSDIEDSFSDWSSVEETSERISRRKIGNQANIFGTIGDMKNIGEESLNTEIGSHNERFSDDKDDDHGHHIRLATVDRRHSQDWYGLKIEKYGKKGMVKEAVAVLEDWMLKRDRVMPSTYTFSALIGVLGRVGYTKKAFSLFNKMKKMGLQPVDLTYTSLFNACANSPWREDGLSRADKLRELMQHKGHEPNLITYHSMMKAYALQGELRTVFLIMDELLERFQPTPQTFSFLLMACISDRRAGFKHAVEVWRLLSKFKVTPDLHLYNLLLRCVRECGVGNAEFANTLIDQKQEVKNLPQQLADYSERQQQDIFIEAEKQTALALSKSDSPDKSTTVLNPENSLSEWWEDDRSVQRSDLSQTLPNLLDPHCDLSQVVSVGQLRHPEDRLAVIGGVVGFLDAMESVQAIPDVRTFSQLIEVAPSTNEAEIALIAKMESLGVKPDIPFFNTVIRRRCFRREAEGARAVLLLISEARLLPDIYTFSCLAMTCRNKKDGSQLLKDMDQSGIAPNIEILGTLAYASNLDFGYKLAVLEEVENLGLSPNKKFIEVLERSIAIAKQKVVQVEKGKVFDDFISSEYFSSSFREFMKYYKSWLQKTQLEEQSHPWQAFRKQPVEDVEKSEHRN